MKRRLLAIIIAVCISVGVSAPALSAWEDISDVSGHWAEPVMQRAYSDGLIQGFGDGTLRPDDQITGAQMITILCRVLSARLKGGDYASAGLSGEEWYADTYLQALELGLVSDPLAINAPMTRGNALSMLAKAFQLSQAEPDYTVLDGFSDASALRGQSRRVMASLVSSGYVQGYADSLGVDRNISRAEFLTVLYRVATNAAVPPGTTDAISSGIIISEVSSLADSKYVYPVWLDCSTQGLTLQNVAAPMLVVRSQSLSSVQLSGSTAIDRLVLAGSGAAKLSLSPYGSSRVGTLVIGDTSGEVSAGGNVGRVEITGSGRTVTLSSGVSELVISGEDNTVTINSGTSLSELRVAGDAKGNKIVINGFVTNLTDNGGSDISGFGRVTNAAVNSALDGQITVNVTNLSDLRDTGIEGASLSIEVAEILPAGQTLSARAVLDVPDTALGKLAKLSWYIDGALIMSRELSVGLGETAVFEYDFSYSRDMPGSALLKAVVSYTTLEGFEQSAEAEAEVALENYDEEYYAQYEIDAVLARVKTGYAGDYTLEWALNHDYDQQTKTIWINAKGYSSSTNYLIWVSLSHQRVNIFQGSKGNWELLSEYLCASGARGTATPVGVYTVFGRQTGWFTSSYTCRPVVNFKTGSGYAFHSRLYYPGNSNEFVDDRIGYPVSHGCLRMYSEDITWMYNNIPIGTTVVVF